MQHGSARMTLLRGPSLRLLCAAITTGMEQVKSSTNTPVMQGAKQMHIERRCDCELPRQSCRLGRACVGFFFTQVLLWFCLELPRKGSANGGGIRDARVEVHPVNWLTPEVRNPERHRNISSTPMAEILVPPSVGSRQPRKILRTAFGKQLLCGRLILTHRSHIKRMCIKVLKAHSSQE